MTFIKKIEAVREADNRLVGNHTRAPWRPSVFFDNVVNDAGKIVCRLPDRVTDALYERAANGNLIAAAPDMLAALKEARDWLDSLNWGGEENGAKMDRIRTAIAKAEGRA